MEYKALKDIPAALKGIASFDVVDNNIKSIKITVDGKEFLIRAAWDNIVFAEAVVKLAYFVEGAIASINAPAKIGPFEDEESAEKAATENFAPGYKITSSPIE